MNRNRTTVLAGFIAAALLSSQSVASGERLPETWKEASIATAYTLNEHLDPFDIDVEVRGDTAFLQGTVGSDVERDLAARIATSVDGVTAVRNNLRVQPGGPRAGRDRFARAVRDATITARIESQLLWNRSTSALDVAVSTDAGIVTLQGSVRDDSEAGLVEHIAQDTNGVIGVQNQLTVASTAGEQTLTEDLGRAVDSLGDGARDAWITTKITSALVYNRQVDGTDIGVATRDGVVTLTGTVSHRAELQRAIDIAAGIAGVTDVSSSLLIEPAQS